MCGSELQLVNNKGVSSNRPRRFARQLASDVQDAARVDLIIIDFIFTIRQYDMTSLVGVHGIAANHKKEGGLSICSLFASLQQADDVPGTKRRRPTAKGGDC